VPSEAPIERLGTLAESLGFKETPELEWLRRQITRAESLDEVTVPYGEYHRLGQEVVGQADKDAYGAAQLGLTVALARVWWEWGDSNRFIEVAGDASAQATGIRSKEAARLLEEALAQAEEDRAEVQRLVRACSGVVDQEDLDELASKPLGQAMAAIYPLLYAAGQDADEFLRRHGFEVAVPGDDEA